MSTALITAAGMIEAQHFFNDEMKKDYGIISIGPRETPVAFGAANERMRSWQITCETSAQAKRLSDDLSQTLHGLACTFETSQEGTACVFAPNDLIKVHQAIILRTALAGKLGLSEEEAAAIRINVEPFPGGSSVLETRLWLTMPRDESRQQAYHKIVDGLRKLLADDSLFVLNPTDTDPAIPGDFLPNREVDTQALYQALNVEMPAFLLPASKGAIEGRVKG